MKHIGNISFVTLDGEPPAHLQLERLPAADNVAAVVQESLVPFGTATCHLDHVRPCEAITGTDTDLQVVYIYGHAWLKNGCLTSSINEGGQSVERPLVELLEAILINLDRDRTLLIFDCCHAAAIRRSFGDSGVHMAVYACALDEKAIALTDAQATRLSIALREELANAASQISLADIIENTAVRLEKDGVISGQSVSFDTTGALILLNRRAPSRGHRRDRTVKRVRQRLFVMGGIAVAAVLATGWYGRNHTILEIDLAGLGREATNIRIFATAEYPDTNDIKVVAEKGLTSGNSRLFLPVGNTILRINADYPDGEPRAISLHILTRPAFGISSKLLRWKLPPAEDVLAHPGMAFVPATPWIRGRDRDLEYNDAAYWIDIRPPTVTEYADVASKLFESGRLEVADSFILEGNRNATAINSVGLEQLGQLNKDLGAILGALEAGTSNTVAAPGDLVNGLGELACPSCPAPMERGEAQLYCEDRGLKLPTDKQWELAVRGIDGRTFPWGNLFDSSKANVPGLPDKGDAPPSLKPVADYARHLSPFGLYDTVGNAGDWVVNTRGAYEAVYMGATWRYNPEDATTFRILPMTDETSLVREITTRCVDEHSDN